jgi:hypothetical protein
MPKKGLPECQHCKRRGVYCRLWHVIEGTRTAVTLRCVKCGGGALSRSHAAFDLLRKKERPASPLTKGDA